MISPVHLEQVPSAVRPSHQQSVCSSTHRIAQTRTPFQPHRMREIDLMLTVKYLNKVLQWGPEPHTQPFRGQHLPLCYATSHVQPSTIATPATAQANPVASGGVRGTQTLAMHMACYMHLYKFFFHSTILFFSP